MNKILTAQEMTDKGHNPIPTWEEGKFTGPATAQFGPWTFKWDSKRSHSIFIVYVLAIPHNPQVAVFEIVKNHLEPVGRVSMTEEEFALLENGARGPENLWDIKKLCA